MSIDDERIYAFWAHGHNAEAQALGELLEFFRARLADFPSARIYHYAAYEITALRRLTTKYGIVVRRELPPSPCPRDHLDPA